MNKLVLCALLVLAVVALSDARGRRGGFGGHGGRGGTSLSAGERSFAGKREGLNKGNRGRLALQKGSGLRKGNRARGRRGRGNRLSAGNRVAGERFNNHKEFSDVGAVNDLRKSNNFALQLQKSDDLAKHQAVKSNNGVEHSSGERVMKEEVLDKEDYSQEEVEAEDIFQKQDNLGVDAANEDQLHAISETKAQQEASFGFSDDGGFGKFGF